MPIAFLLPAALAFHATLVPSQTTTRRAADCLLAEGAVFKTPKSTDVAAEEQARKAAMSGMSPQEYAKATTQAANDYLQTNGAHVGTPSSAKQSAGFLKQIWDVDSIPAIPEEAASDPSHVLATVYEIGGPLTDILSTSVAKKLPLIPHVGIRVHGVEYFYSDHIEYRTVPVMEEMLGDRPQVTLDLGPCDMSADEVKAVVDGLEAQWTAEDYHVFDKNCVHFAQVLGDKVASDGVPQPLLQVRTRLHALPRAHAPPALPLRG